MCRYCVEYGNGTKWYLNPHNYSVEVMNNPSHADAIKSLGGVSKINFEVSIAAGIDDAIPDLNYPDNANNVLETTLNHAGQIVPLEDALKVVDLSKAPWLRMHCVCRKYFGQGDLKICLYPAPVSELAIKERTWEEHELLDAEQAKAHLRETAKKGYVHSIWHGGVHPDGIPVLAICSCAYPDCMGIRGREVYGAMNAMRKGEYVAQIIGDKCKEGCGTKERLCMSRCYFGALRYSPTHGRVFVLPNKCFGCGACRNVCSSGAIKLVERTTYPSLVDEW